MVLKPIQNKLICILIMQSEATAIPTAKIPVISYTSWCVLISTALTRLEQSCTFHITTIDQKLFPPISLQITVLTHHFYCLICLFCFRERNSFLMCIDIHIYFPLPTDGSGPPKSHQWTSQVGRTCFFQALFSMLFLLYFFSNRVFRLMAFQIPSERVCGGIYWSYSG